MTFSGMTSFHIKNKLFRVLDVSKENATFATVALSYNITKTKGINAAII